MKFLSLRIQPKAILGALLVIVLAKATPDAAQEDAHRAAISHYKAGQSAMSHEQFDEAIQEFKQAIALDPALLMAHYGLGKAHMSLQEYREAVMAFVNCRKAFEDGIASQLRDAADWERRMDDEIHALEDEVTAANAARFGTVAMHTSASRDATELQTQLDTLKARRKAHITSPPPTPAWLSVALGSAYFHSEALVDAEREYKAAIDANPKMGEAHNNLAVVYLLTNRGDAAQGEVVLAERSGFRVAEGLKRDIAQLRSKETTP